MTPYCCFENPNCSIRSLSFSPDDKFLAAASDKGEILIYSVANKKKLCVYPIQKSQSSFTSVKWRNNKEGMAHNVVTFSDSDGRIQSFNINTRKQIMQIEEKFEDDPQIYSIDYDQDCTELAVVGANPVVRVYDLETKKLKLTLEGKGGLVLGHSNRVFSVKHVKNQKVLVSSGWDQRTIFWDTKSGEAFDSIFGTQVYGDGIDVNDGIVLTSNFRDKKAIQLLFN